MKWKLEIVILLGIMAIIGISIYFVELLALIVLYWTGLLFLGLLVFVTLGVSWEHPKWYVKLYTVVCFLWLVFHYFYWLENPCLEWAHPLTYFLFCDVAPNALPLVPLWYLAYKGHKLKKEE